MVQMLPWKKGEESGGLLVPGVLIWVLRYGLLLQFKVPK
jgi:hypothetical protein